MSTKSKNPFFKRVKISVTQEIIDKSYPNRPSNCYFYHAMVNLLKFDSFCVWLNEYAIDGINFSLSKKANAYVKGGIDGKTVVPTDFHIYIPVKYLK